MTGDTVGEYKITAALGPGGLGETFSAEHATTGEKAIVEIVGEPLASNAEALAKYADDQKKLATLKQASLVRVIEVGVDATGRTFVVTAVPEGETLAKRVEAMGRLSITQICETAKQIANALAAVHDEGVIHGDLRPECIYLQAQEGGLRVEPVKVAEAGVGFAKRVTGVNVPPSYTAPEVWSASSREWRIDAYALGCVMFEMATGKPPYVGKSENPDSEIRAKHLSAPTPSARSMMPDVPPTLDVMLGRLLSKVPEDRYGSMREIARALDALGAQSGKSFAPTATDTPVFQMSDEDKARLMGTEGVTSGELKARPAPPPEHSMRPEPAPVPAQQPAGSEFPGARDTGAGDTQSIRKQGGSKLALVVILVLVLAGGGIAIAVAL